MGCSLAWRRCSCSWTPSRRWHGCAWLRRWRSAATKQIELGEARARVLVREMGTPSIEPAVVIPKAVRHASAHRRRLCLAFVAENPGASNQAIAVGIDLSHLGQVSTALSRLKNAGLLTLHAGGAGLPNAWWISPQGEQVARALAVEPHQRFKCEPRPLSGERRGGRGGGPGGGSCSAAVPLPRPRTARSSLYAGPVRTAARSSVVSRMLATR